MAIALTPFEALCGFRRPHEMSKALHDFPELAAVVGDAGMSLLLF